MLIVWGFFPSKSLKRTALIFQDIPLFTFGFIICDSNNHPYLLTHG